MTAPIARVDAARRLRRGDCLVHDRSAGTWSLLRDGGAVSPLDAAALLADRRIALCPGEDGLPGFGADASQTYRCGPDRRRQPSGSRRRRGALPDTAFPASMSSPPQEAPDP